MKTKMSKKLISAVLAFCLVFSCAFQAFAADGYTATYSDKATKNVYSTILEDANDLLSEAALTGATIQSVYAILPNLKPVLPDAIKADFYKTVDADAFAKLDEFMTANSHTDVTVEVLNAYFAENPIELKDSAEFTAKLKNVVSAVMTPNVFSTVVMVLVMGGSMTPSIGEAKMPEFFGCIDNISKVLGAEQEKTLFEILQAQEDGNVMLATYINNIIDALIPDVSNNVVGILQNLASKENNILLYKSLTTFFPMLSDMLNTFGPMIGSFVPGLDITPIQKPVEDIKNTLAVLPTVGDGENKMFDYEGSIAYLVNDVVVPQIAGKRMDVISFGEGGNGIVKLDKFNLANLENAKDDTDAFNVIFNYLYNNLNKAETKELLSTVLPMIPSLVPDFPKEVADYLTFLLNNTKDDSAFQLYALLRIATGHSSEMGELTPADPVEPKPVDPENPTDPENPNKPDTKPVEPDVKPAEPSAQGDKVSDPKLPNTGLVEDGSSMTMYVMATAALGLVLVLIVAKKRGSFNA